MEVDHESIDLGQECNSDLIDLQTPHTDDVVFTEEVSGSLTREDPPQGNSDEKTDTEEVSELSEPQPMTPVEDLVMTSSPSSQQGGTNTSDAPPPPVEPARTSAATQTENSAQSGDWPKLWSNSTGNQNELVATEPDPVPTSVRADLVKKAKDTGKILVLNGRVASTSGGNDRCKVLSHRILQLLAENADVLHTKEFREGECMMNIIGISQLLYHSESKYCDTAKFVLRSSLAGFEKRQSKFYAGREASIVIKDGPEDPAPQSTGESSTLPSKSFWNPTVRLIGMPPSTPESAPGPSSKLVAPPPLTATPTLRTPTKTTSSGSAWPVPASNNNGWGASSSTDWSEPVATTSSGWGAPAEPKPASSTQDEGDRNTVKYLQKQIDSLRKRLDDRDADKPRRGAQRGRNFGRGRGMRARW